MLKMGNRTFSEYRQIQKNKIEDGKKTEQTDLVNYIKSKSISTVSLFYMEDDREANQRSAFSLSFNVIEKHQKWI